MAPPPPPTRDLDLVVFGATGFTGKLVAEHLAKSYSSGDKKVRYALAGRDAARLEAARAEVAKHAPLAAGAELVAVDPTDHAALVRLFGRARAVISTAGPYQLYGTPIVKAAVDAGAHYCDITGELSWVASLRDAEKLDDKARAAGVKVVPCCGYDCVPSDLGAFMAAEELKRRGAAVGRIETVIDGSMMDGGGVSGGTAASALNLMGDSKAMAVASDPYVCFPPAEAEEKKARLRARRVAPARPYPPLRLFRRSPALAVSPSSSSSSSSSSGWAVSWPLGGANCAVIRRSASLLGYGRVGGSGGGDDNAEASSEASEVEVDETVEFPSLKHAAIFDAGIAAIGAAVLAGSLLPLVKRWLGAKVPQPGQGPSRDKMLHAPWRHAVVATAAASAENGASASAAPPPPVTVRGVVGGPQDRGYYMTARMVLEAGLALASSSQRDESKSSPSPSASASPPSAGILTPAAAMGHTLLGRLRAAGFTFEIEK